VAKVDAETGEVLDRVRTGRAPRSAVLSPDGTALFVVNYESGTVSRVRTSDLKVLESRPVDHHPIGITYNPATQEVWVCSYIGVINVFADAVV
jgi:YVTN family beta-propeller protein